MRNRKYILSQGILLVAVISMQILVYNGASLFYKYPDWFTNYQFYIEPWYCGILLILPLWALYEIIRNKGFVFGVIILQYLGVIYSVKSYNAFLCSYAGTDANEVVKFIFIPYIIIAAISIGLWFLYLHLRRGIDEKK